MKIKKGDEVLLISEEGHKYIVTAEDRIMSVSDGQLNLKKLIGASYGKPLKTHLGKEYFVLLPGFIDRLEKLKRGPQVVLPKDAAAMVAYTGISSGAKVVDAGTGSGWLAAFLANIVAPGKVVSYEIRKDHHKLAKDNIKRLGLKNVKLKLADITKGIKERNLDLITLDLLTPTKVPNIPKALKLGGYCVAYVPHIEQARGFSDFAEKQGLFADRIIALRQNEFAMGGGRLKQKRQFPHTGFMVFARKVRK